MEVEYIDEIHTYLVDCVIVPSVTQIIETMFDSYSKVPKATLKISADFGSRIHEMIESYEKGELDETTLTLFDSVMLDSYKDIVKKHQIEVVDMEQIIYYKDKYAGRYDILARVNGELAIVDIKTTSKLLTDHLELQLSMYVLGLEYCRGIKVSKGYCIWLPKKKEAPAFKEIKLKTKEEILEVLEEYDKRHDEN